MGRCTALRRCVQRGWLGGGFFVKRKKALKPVDVCSEGPNTLKPEGWRDMSFFETCVVSTFHGLFLGVYLGRTDVWCVNSVGLKVDKARLWEEPCPPLCPSLCKQTCCQRLLKGVFGPYRKACYRVYVYLLLFHWHLEQKCCLLWLIRQSSSLKALRPTDHHNSEADALGLLRGINQS